MVERLRAAGGLDRAVRVAEEVIADELAELQARAARRSCSWSDPETAKRCGAKREGDEMGWPNGERWPVGS